MTSAPPSPAPRSSASARCSTSATAPCRRCGTRSRTLARRLPRPPRRPGWASTTITSETGWRARAPGRCRIRPLRAERAEPIAMTTTTVTRPRLDPRDPAGIDALLSEEELAVRDTVRSFCTDKVLPFVGDWYERGELPGARELAQELGKIGLLGMHLSGYGCAGMSAVDYGLACLELEAADSGLRSLVSVQGSLAMFAIWRWGTEEHKQSWLPRMAAGEALGCFGLTEPDAGSDPASMRTSARRDGPDWVLSGRKMWITNGTIT